MVERMIRAARLDPGVYNELERDLTASGQALLVVIIASLATGIGSFVRLTIQGHPGAATGGLIGGVITGIIGFAIFVTLVYFIGTSVFGGTATPGEVLRTVGFAHTPLLLGFFGFIPCLGGLAVFIGFIWSWVASVIAVREALDVDTGKSILTIIIAAVVVLVAALVIGFVLAIFGVGIAILTGAL